MYNAILDECVRETAKKSESNDIDLQLENCDVTHRH